MPARILSADEAISHIKDGQRVMVGGFGLIGFPLVLLEALERSSACDLTIIANNMGRPNVGLGRILLQNKVRKIIGSYFTTNPDVIRYYREGRLEIEILPQGTLAEAVRAGGAGIGGFYVRTGVGTELAEGKEARVFDGAEYVLERALKADVALIKAHRADLLGNLTYSKTARNFNSLMATAADFVIAEVDELVEVGQIPSEAVVTPHILVDVLVI